MSSSARRGPDGPTQSRQLPRGVLGLASTRGTEPSANYAAVRGGWASLFESGAPRWAPLEPPACGRSGQIGWRDTLSSPGAGGGWREETGTRRLSCYIHWYNCWYIVDPAHARAPEEPSNALRNQDDFSIDSPSFGRKGMAEDSGCGSWVSPVAPSADFLLLCPESFSLAGLTRSVPITPSAQARRSSSISSGWRSSKRNRFMTAGVGTTLPVS